MGNTFILMGTSLIFSILVAIPLGIFLAVNKNSITSKVSSVFNYIGVSIPSFWIGMILISIFQLNLTFSHQEVCILLEMIVLEI